MLFHFHSDLIHYVNNTSSFNLRKYLNINRKVSIATTFPMSCEVLIIDQLVLLFILSSSLDYQALFTEFDQFKWLNSIHWKAVIKFVKKQARVCLRWKKTSYCWRLCDQPSKIAVVKLQIRLVWDKEIREETVLCDSAPKMIWRSIFQNDFFTI